MSGSKKVVGSMTATVGHEAWEESPGVDAGELSPQPCPCPLALVGDSGHLGLEVCWVLCFLPCFSKSVLQSQAPSRPVSAVLHKVPP